jgi:hypothetical protein
VGCEVFLVEARKLQVVVMPSTPAPIKSSMAALNASSISGPSGLLMRFRVASRTMRYCTGNGHVHALPMSPLNRSKEVSSIRMPMETP